MPLRSISMETMSAKSDYSLDQFELLKMALRKKGSVEIRLVSNSMAPLLPTGTTARLEPCDFERVSRYDMIVFWYHGKLMCHCVWDFGSFPAANGEKTLITRGLANGESDDPVHESWILGKVVSHKVGPFGFYWNYLKARLGLMGKSV